MIYIGFMLLGAALYFTYRFGIVWLYDALSREHVRREVEKEVQKIERERNYVMFFEHDEVWPEEKKEAV